MSCQISGDSSRPRGLRSALWITGLLTVITVAGCGDGGDGDTTQNTSGSSSTGTPAPSTGGSTAPANEAPALAELTLSTDSVDIMAGNGRVEVTATARFTDRDADVATMRIETGASVTIVPVSSTATSGQAVGEFELRTATSGTITATVWVIDRAGNASNRMSAVLTIRGSAKLSALSLSPATLDPPFTPARTSYSSLVDFSVASVSVAAVALDWEAIVRINGAEASSHTNVPLVVGENTIAREVRSGDGIVAPYELKVRRQGNAKLKDLSLSAGKLDQIFQPGLTDYTASVGLLRPTTTVTPTLDDPAATVTVNGRTVGSGTASRKVTLDQGANAIAIEVTAADGITRSTYTVDVTRGTAAALRQELYLKSDSPAGRPWIFCCNFPQGDRYGSSLAFANGMLAVGALGEDAISGTVDSGGVSLYSRDSSGAWQKAGRLLPPYAPNYRDDLFFGVKVALAGETVFVAEVRGNPGGAVGAPVMDGRVHVFTRQANGWGAVAELVRAQPQLSGPYNEFGVALAAQGDTVVVGDPSAPLRPANSSVNLRVGDATVFTRTANGWVRSQTLTSPAPDDYDRFGQVVALDGDTIAIGAPAEDSATADPFDNSRTDSGAVFVWRRQASIWSLEAVVKAPNAEAGDWFGGAVALSGDTLAVGAYGEDSSALGSGGSPLDNGATDSGAVYVFRRDEAGQWILEAYLKASNARAGDGFGAPFRFATHIQAPSIALQDDVLAVGSNGEDSAALGVNGDQASNSAPNAGAVYVFARDAERRWSQTAYLKASNAEANDGFGTVALDGDVIVVGAPGEGSLSGGLNADQSNGVYSTGTDTYPYSDAGAVYVFR